MRRQRREGTRRQQGKEECFEGTEGWREREREGRERREREERREKRGGNVSLGIYL